MRTRFLFALAGTILIAACDDSRSSTAQPSPTPDPLAAEEAELRAMEEELARLEKEIAEEDRRLAAVTPTPAPQRPQAASTPRSTGVQRSAPDRGTTQGPEMFYSALEPYGEWFEVEPYGAVWQPATVRNNRGWRPYRDGRWVYTDAGWLWRGDEPFGWATYHYGRWVNLERIGWTWVPGDEWAPAWVSWRTGDEYVGWAPLPPEAAWNDQPIGGWVEERYDIGPAAYSFVPVTAFAEPNYGSYYVDTRRNWDIIQSTSNVTNIVSNVVNIAVGLNIFAGGPQYEVIERRSRRRIPRQTIVLADPDIDRLRTPGGYSELLAWDANAEQIPVVAPRLEMRRDARPPRIRQRLGRVERAVSTDVGQLEAFESPAAPVVTRSPDSEMAVPEETNRREELRRKREEARRRLEELRGEKNASPSPAPSSTPLTAPDERQELDRRRERLEERRKEIEERSPESVSPSPSPGPEVPSTSEGSPSVEPSPAPTDRREELDRRRQRLEERQRELQQRTNGVPAATPSPADSAASPSPADDRREELDRRRQRLEERQRELQQRTNGAPAATPSSAETAASPSPADDRR
ncbi:MAG: DUF6600 domain-containing protein [Terrimicrobiaceae bacterium]|nr:DUF6600 domain-containing protein [Terrimicrobiaceae bacterium]